MNIVKIVIFKNYIEIFDKINILILGGGMFGLELVKYLNNRVVENIVIIEVGLVDDCNYINVGEDF